MAVCTAEPSSLTSFQRSVQRFLNFANSPLNIFKDQEFAKSREVLVARKRQLVESFAKGNRPQSARALTEAEEDLLFEKGLLETTSQKFYREQFGGLYLFTLVFVLEMSQEN